jgi:hypothetical protein
VSLVERLGKVLKHIWDVEHDCLPVFLCWWGIADAFEGMRGFDIHKLNGWMVENMPECLERMYESLKMALEIKKGKE